MVERTPVLNAITHVVMALGLIVLLLPLWVVFVASTHSYEDVNKVPMSLLPGSHFWENYALVWEKGNFGTAMLNSLVVAIGVTAGKVFIAAISAFSIVFFAYRLRMVFFWMIFITLMLPLEVRIVPTYAVAANVLDPFQAILGALGLSVSLPEWNLLNTYTGLVLPLVATATGTFLYRQFFMTIPNELVEAAKMDGAGPIRFFWEVLMPLSRNNIAALATIMFVYSWNQYLWPLLITTDASMVTATIQLQKLVPGPLFGQPPVWNEAMAATLLVMLPPLVVVIFMQRWFVRGLVSTDK